MDVISFKELEVSKTCNISEEYQRLTGLAGSVFNRRAEALKGLELAKDNVKAVIAQIEMDTHKLGYIPVEGDPDRKIKITGAAMTAYINCHEKAKKAREDRAEAEYEYDLIRGIVTAYNAVMNAFPVMLSDRKNEFYVGSTATSSPM